MIRSILPALLGGILCWSGAKGDPPRPNLLIIVVDDMGWADVGYHGSELKTPVIDRLAREGVELDQFYVAPMCTPTRVGLLTGRYWSRFGNTAPSNERVLPWKTWTLARALKEVGYSTHLTGKWHLGSKPQWGGRQFGFEQSHGSLAGGVHPWNHLYKPGPYSVTWHRNDKLIDEKGHVTDLISAEAIRFIEGKQGEKPFFIYVPFTAVHDPFDEPKEWLESASQVVPGRRQYAACVQHLDAAIGKILSALKRSGQADQTLVILFSDNGGTNGDGSTKYPEGKANAPIKGLNHPLRGWKTQVYEGGIRVPALVHWPRALKPAKVRTPLHVIDLMPTICGLLEIPEAKDAKWDGVDVWSVLEGKPRRALEEREFYWQGVSKRSAALRQGDWKLVIHRGGKRRVELFHLDADPGEKKDLSAREPERVERMKRALKAQEARDDDALPHDKKSAD